MSQRLDWIDVVKILGIFAIYVGHFGHAAGNLYPFVFAFHVQLFFFVAGFFATTSALLPWRAFIVKKAREILLPFAFFNVLHLAMVVIQGNLGAHDAQALLRPLALGIRNQSPAMTLWFLPCLFIVMVIFDAMRRMRFNIFALLVASAALWATAEWLLPHRPASEPSWAFNADSAFYYILFYAIGAAVFPHIRNLTSAPLSRGARAITAITLTGALFVAVNLYFGRDLLSLLSGAVGVSVKETLYALVMIYVSIAAGFALARFSFLASMGRQTLFYCGNEVIIKTLTPVVLATLGLTINLDNPLSVLVYVAALLVIAHFTVIRVESALIGPLMKKARPRTSLSEPLRTETMSPSYEPVR